MGTNYYAVSKKPTVAEPIHIGKSSAGWTFAIQEQNNPPAVWHSYGEVMQWLKTHDDYVIMNEYDEVITLDEFTEIVERTGGYRLIDQEFI